MSETREEYDAQFEQEKQDDLIAGIDNWHKAEARGYLEIIDALQKRIDELESQLADKERWYKYPEAPKEVKA